MNEQQRYERYCAWCESIGVPPAPFENWRLTLEVKVYDHWSQIRDVVMGKRA